MAMTDPLADMLTRIRNASQVNFAHVDIPMSNVKHNVAKILKREGYIEDVVVVDEGIFRNLRLTLKYDNKKHPVISGVKRKSTPGRRMYSRHSEIPKVMSGLGIAIISTSQGIMADKEAREKKIGGEIICHVW